MKLPPLATAALLALGALAGCAGTTGPPTTLPTAPATPAAAPQFAWNATAGVQFWSDFVQATPKRDVGLPNNAVARGILADGLSAAGYKVETRDYTVPAADAVAGAVKVLHVVVGVRPGTGNATHAIAFGGHFDTQQGTLYGAYDNGSGAAAVVQTCTAIAKVPTNRTVLCLLFDGEEEGTWGSEEFLRDVQSTKQWTLDLYVGFDMVGLNWPGMDPGPSGTWKLYGWVDKESAPALQPFVNDTVHEVLGYPVAGAEVFPFNDRNSDEATFIAGQVPTLRLAGGRTAGAWPQYHMPGDTVDAVYQFAGGRANYERGFGAIVTVAATVGVLFDEANGLPAT